MSQSRRSARGPLRRSALTTLAALLVLAGTASSAAAHTTLDSSNPRDGGTVRSLETVTLRFAGPVSSDAASVVMTTEDDERVPLSAPRVTDDTMTAEISGSQPDPGRYVLSYSVRSVDGDAVTGSLAFTLAGSAEGQRGAASESPTTTPTPTSPTPTPGPTASPADINSATSAPEDGAGTLVLGLALAAAVLGGAAYMVVSRRRARP